MAEKPTLADIKARLDGMNIHEIRQVARACGIASPTVGKKERIIDELIKICSGELAPAARSTRGAPPKSETYDRQFVADFNLCMADCIARRGVKSGESTVQLASSEYYEQPAENSTASGVLYKYDKHCFLSVGLSAISRKHDIYVHDSFVRRFNLRAGDKIECTAQRKDLDRAPALVGVLSVNGLAPETAKIRTDFDGSSAVYPNKKIPLSPAGAEGNIIDLFSPLAAGQRGLIVGSARRGATTLILKIAQTLAEREDITVVCLLAGARPEEISDFTALNGVTVFHTAFHFAEEEKARVADIALDYSKRQAELGKDVMLLVDNANRLARAYAYAARLSTEISGNILKFLSSARATQQSGSLSIISALSITDNAADKELYSELRDACNLQITLSDDLALKGLYPAIDVKSSFSAHAEKFCTREEVTLAATARTLPPEKIIKEAHISPTFGQFKAQLK